MRNEVWRAVEAAPYSSNLREGETGGRSSQCLGWTCSSLLGPLWGSLLLSVLLVGKGRMQGSSGEQEEGDNSAFTWRLFNER